MRPRTRVIMKKVSVLLVDDHPVVRQGLCALLKAHADFEVVEEADNGRAAVALARQTRPDVVIMDISMPLMNGAEATRQIRKAVPSTKVLVLSSYCEDELVEHLMQAGAVGYVSKDSAPSDLAGAIRAVCGGKMFFSASVARRLRQRYLSPVLAGKSAESDPELTSRQAEVLQLVAEGLSSGQIAVELGISDETAEKHLQLLMEKLKVDEIAGLSRTATAVQGPGG